MSLLGVHKNEIVTGLLLGPHVSMISNIHIYSIVRYNVIHC